MLHRPPRWALLLPDCQDTVVAQLHAMLKKKVDAKRASLERLLGAPLRPLLEAVEAALAPKGKALEGKKDKGIKKKALSRLLRRLVLGPPKKKASGKKGAKSKKKRKAGSKASKPGSRAWSSHCHQQRPTAYPRTCFQAI